MGFKVKVTGTVTIISSSEGFFTKGMEAKIKELGYETAFATLNEGNRELGRIRQGTGLYVLYMQDEIEQKTLLDLHDILNMDAKKVIIIGEGEDYDQMKKIIPVTQILKWLDRPLDMNAFLKCVREYYEEEEEVIEKKTILIVDDDITYMRLIYDWLKDDYTVGMASSGVQAISWLVKNTADLVLMDYEMPVVSGPQVVQMLHSDSTTGAIPVMFLTGKNEKEFVMSVVDLKPVDYLLKTIDKMALLGKIKKFFETQRANKKSEN